MILLTYKKKEKKLDDMWVEDDSLFFPTLFIS